MVREFKYLDDSGYPSHGFDTNIKSRLVYDGKTLYLPKEFAPVRDGATITETDFNALMTDKQQLQGNDKEVLCELAGRICYDSLGQGRSTVKYWQHIREVGHGSVLEHGYYTLRLPVPESSIPLYFDALMNRRGVWVEFGGTGFQITLNFRAVMEWDYWTLRKYNRLPEDRPPPIPTSSTIGLLLGTAQQIGESFYETVRHEAPLVLPEKELVYGNKLLPVEIDRPRNVNEVTISLFRSASRGDSHEMVRHRENMSQRSSRFCQESESPYVQHPLVTAFLNDTGEIAATTDAVRRAGCRYDIEMSVQADHKTYDNLVDALQQYVKRKNPGIDATTARKQARGAARGYLGNALFTEMVFTCSVASWREIIRKRASNAADAEIRNTTAQSLYALKTSAYGDYFSDFELQPAKDGLGLVVTDAKH